MGLNELKTWPRGLCIFYLYLISIIPDYKIFSLTCKVQFGREFLQMFAVVFHPIDYFRDVCWIGVLPFFWQQE